MGRILRRAFRLAGLAIALIAIAAIVFVLVFDIGAYRDQIAQRASEVAGRDVTINGPMDLEWGFTPRLILNDVTIAGADGDPPLVTVRRVEVLTALFPLALGQVDVLEMTAEQADIVVNAGGAAIAGWQRSAGDGAANADTADAVARAGPSDLPPIHLSDSTLAIRRNDETVTVTIDDARIDVERETLLTAAGTYRDARWQLNATLPPVLDGTGGQLDARLALAGATLTVSGPVHVSNGNADINVDLSLDADDLSGLGTLIGVDLSGVSPIQIDAGLVGGLSRLDANNFVLQVGSGRITGDLTARLLADVPEITAELSADRVDLSAAGTPAAPTAPAPLAAPRLLPSGVALNLQVSIGALVLPGGATVGPVSMVVESADEGLIVDAQTEGVLDGLLQLRGTVSDSQPGMAYVGDVALSGFALAPAFGPWALGQGWAEGRLSSSGAGWQDWRRNVTGTLTLTVPDGAIDVQRLAAGAEAVPAGLVDRVPGRLSLRCGYAEFDVEGSSWRSTAFALDTELGPIGGQADIDWSGERLDIVLRPSPDAPLAEVPASAIRISGPFAGPRVVMGDEGLLEQSGELIRGTLETLAQPLAILGEGGPGAVSCQALAR